MDTYNEHMVRPKRQTLPGNIQAPHIEIEPPHDQQTQITEIKDQMREQEMLLATQRQNLICALVRRQKSVSSGGSPNSSRYSSCTSINMVEEIEKLQREQSESLIKLRQDSIKALVRLTPTHSRKSSRRSHDLVDTAKLNLCKTCPKSNALDKSKSDIDSCKTSSGLRNTIPKSNVPDKCGCQITNCETSAKLRNTIPQINKAKLADDPIPQSYTPDKAHDFNNFGRYSFRAYYKLHKSNTFSTQHRMGLKRLASISDDDIVRRKTLPVPERNTNSGYNQTTRLPRKFGKNVISHSTPTQERTNQQLFEHTYDNVNFTGVPAQKSYSLDRNYDYNSQISHFRQPFQYNDERSRYIDVVAPASGYVRDNSSYCSSNSSSSSSYVSLFDEHNGTDDDYEYIGEQENNKKATLHPAIHNKLQRNDINNENIRQFHLSQQSNSNIENISSIQHQMDSHTLVASQIPENVDSASHKVIMRSSLKQNSQDPKCTESRAQKIRLDLGAITKMEEEIKMLKIHNEAVVEKRVSIPKIETMKAIKPSTFEHHSKWAKKIKCIIM